MKHTLTLIIHLGVLLTWVKADFTNEDDYLKKMHNFSAYFDSSTFSRGLARENLDWATLRGKAEKACLKDRHFSDKTLDSDCSIYFVHNHKAGKIYFSVNLSPIQALFNTTQEGQQCAT